MPGAPLRLVRAVLLVALLIGSLLGVVIGIITVAPKAQAQPMTQWYHAYGGSVADYGHFVVPPEMHF